MWRYANGACIAAIVINIYCTYTDGLSLDQKGREFMLSFIDPSPLKTGGEVYLVVNADEKSSVYVSMPSLNINLQQNLDERESWKFTISTELRCSTYFTPVKMAVNVTSTGKVTVYVEDGMMTFASGYLALPYHGLSTSYIAVTYGGWDDSSIYPVFLIVATEDDTSVVIDYVVEDNGVCDHFVSGSRGDVTLNSADVYAVRCTGDFTGSRIGSDKPIVVISGHQGAKVDGLYRDIVQEMLLPVDHFGTSHVLIGHSGRVQGAVNRVVAARDDTTVTSNTGHRYSLSQSQFLDIETDGLGEHWQCIKSDKPVLVVAFAKSRPALYPVPFNVFMSIVPATTQFSRYTETDFGLGSVMGTEETVYMVIVVNASEANVIKSLPSGVATSITNCDFIVVTIEVISWPVHIEDSNVSVGLSIYTTYGPAKSAGVGFPFNIEFFNNDSLVEQSTESTSTSSLTMETTESDLETTIETTALMESTDSVLIEPTHSVPIETTDSVPIETTASVLIETTASVLIETITTAPITLSALPSTVTEVPGSNTSLQESCDCVCRDDLPRNITPELVKLWEDAIQKKLLLYTGNLSKTVRKLTSARDDRPSAAGIGTMGICIFSLIGALIVLPDIGSCLIRILNSRPQSGNAVADQSK